MTTRARYAPGAPDERQSNSGEGRRPADSPKQWQGLWLPLAVAHRFGNEPATIQEAESIGVDLVEADVWLYRGQLEVRHTKTMGPIPILWDRWSLERGWNGRFQFADLLEALDPETNVMVDVKGRAAELPARLVETFRAHQTTKPLLVCSQNWDLLERFRPFPNVVLVHSIGNRASLRKAWARLERDDHDAVSIQYRLLNADVVRALKSRVSLVITWPINDDGRMDRVLAWGVDGIISDDAELIRRFLGRRGAG